MKQEKIKCKFCGLEIKENELDDLIGICEFCLKKVWEEEKENENNNGR